jgi:hypothetical protein
MQKVLPVDDIKTELRKLIKGRNTQQKVVLRASIVLGYIEGQRGHRAFPEYFSSNSRSLDCPFYRAGYTRYSQRQNAPWQKESHQQGNRGHDRAYHSPWFPTERPHALDGTSDGGACRCLQDVRAQDMEEVSHTASSYANIQDLLLSVEKSQIQKSFAH